MLNPLQNKDVATEGFPCYPGGRPGYRRCSVWLPCPSDKASTGICLLRGKQGWHQRDWQLNRLVASTILLAMPRQLVLCEHGAGEPSWFQVQGPRCLYRGCSFWSPKVSMGRDSRPSPGCYWGQSVLQAGLKGQKSMFADSLPLDLFSFLSSLFPLTSWNGSIM